MVAKVPREGGGYSRTQMVNKIKYEKLLLQQFRGAKSRALCKYYNTVQCSFEYS